MEKATTVITFDFDIGETLYNKPPEDYNGFPNNQGLVRYVAVSRIYEEIGTSGNGVVSYVVRHNDPTTPGGGKLFKFAQDELVNSNAYDTLVSLKKRARGEPEYSLSTYPNPNFPPTWVNPIGPGVAISPINSNSFP